MILVRDISTIAGMARMHGEENFNVPGWITGVSLSIYLKGSGPLPVSMEAKAGDLYLTNDLLDEVRIPAILPISDDPEIPDMEFPSKNPAFSHRPTGFLQTQLFLPEGLAEWNYHHQLGIPAKIVLVLKFERQ